MCLKKSCAALFLSVSLLISIAFAGVEAPFEIGTWGNFAKGAVSHTFDDWPTSNATQITATGMDAFDAKKIPMTIFVNTDGLSTNNWNSLKTAFSHGHEVGSHNQQHNSNSSGVKPSHDAIVKNVPGEKAVSMAYPNCNTPGDAEVLKYYVAGRNCNGQINNKTPGNFAQIGAVGVGAGQGNYTNDAAGINAIADQAVTKNGWAVCMHHGIGSDRHSWATTNLDEMKKHLEYLDKNRDKIWAETFGNVALYINERDDASLTVKSSTDSKITVSLTDNLPDTIYNYPLTIRRPLPDGWTTASVLQKDKPVVDTIVTVNSKKYVMFNAIPDGGDIVITRDGVSVNKLFSDALTPGSVVVSKGLIIINPKGFSGSVISVSLFNLNGKIVTSYSSKNTATSFSVPFNVSANSAFVVKVTDGKTTVVSRYLSKM
ncbi:MAG TPA: polysaccharide deacetylase family protein [Chitinispirillaceae bacterium]|nr:polysaccharide deacetylase family protein [Chitinispirillaceae bacterium]